MVHINATRACSVTSKPLIHTNTTNQITFSKKTVQGFVTSSSVISLLANQDPFEKLQKNKNNPYIAAHQLPF